MTLLKKLKLKNFVMLTIAGIVNSIGAVMLLNYAGLIDSGASGLSMLLSHTRVLGQFGLTISTLLLIINIPLFIFGLKKQGLIFTIYAIYVVCIYSLSAFILNKFIIPIILKNSFKVIYTEVLLCAIFGGLISGVGSGLAIRYGGVMDGIEVLAVIFAKKLGLTIGTFVMIFNVIIYVVFAFIIKEWVSCLYSIIAYAVGLKAVDFIVEGLDRSKSAMIVTEKHEEVCAVLSETFKCGITVMDAQGFYSKSNKKVVYIVVNHFQIAKLHEIIKSVDENAYVSISDIADVIIKKKSKSK